MNKKLLLLLIISFSVTLVSAQNQPVIQSNTPSRKLSLETPSEANTPKIEPVFQSIRKFKSLPPLSKISDKTIKDFKVLTHRDGVPTMISGELPIIGTARELPLSARCQQYLEAVKSIMHIKNPVEEFKTKSTETDEIGHTHVRMQQLYKGLPVWGGEVILHDKGGKIDLLNGGYFPTPSVLSIEPSVTVATSIENVMIDLGKSKFEKAFNEEQLRQVGGQRSQSELIIFHKDDNKDAEVLAWHITIYPNVLHRWEYFVDAQSGQILDKYTSSCDLMGHIHDAEKGHDFDNNNNSVNHSLSSSYEANTPLLTPFLDGKFTANATDLLGQNRLINTYQVGTNYYLIDASKSMFNTASSVFPNRPVGVIQTFDNRNTDGGEGSAYYITATNNTWADKKAVSAHYNAGRAFDYFKTTFQRNSINGSGGNITSYINVTDETKQMDNAYWNGESMFYGNGSVAFSPLPAALDVAGHEISHGVVQNTANLRYQGESGAMNESFADIFGAMIDRDDWKMGEDVVKLTYFPSGALRDMANPNNGAAKNTSNWQPAKYSERYIGTQDNGGVHINSGITNRAYYLFATSITKEKAEQVFYRALTKFLVASSKFIDLRAAVEQSCKDLFPNDPSVLTAAQTAFTTVEIGSGGSTNGSDYQKDIPVNAGLDYIVYVSQETGTTPSKLILQQPNSTSKFVLFDKGVLSRPSISDDGSTIVFVGADEKLYYVDIDWTKTPATVTTAATLATTTGWRNIAISRDGDKVAYIKEDNFLNVFSFSKNTGVSYEIYNPTTSNDNSKTYDVTRLDALEWDNTGENIMYDAKTTPPSQDADLSYWDIGLVNVWSNLQKQFVAADDIIVEKLFSGIPENTDIGNPTFAKNSPYIIAFDYAEKDPTTQRYNKFYVVGVNIQTGVITNAGIANASIGIIENNTFGVPTYTNKDDKLVYTKLNGTTLQLATINLKTDKINRGTGSEAILIQSAEKGNWFRNGARTTSLKDELDKNSVVISPNPFGDNLTVEIQAEKSATGRAEIFDLVGRNILSQPLSISGGKNPVSINTQTLQAGAYLLKVTVDGKSLTKKIVKL